MVALDAARYSNNVRFGQGKCTARAVNSSKEGSEGRWGWGKRTEATEEEEPGAVPGLVVPVDRGGRGKGGREGGGRGG